MESMHYIVGTVLYACTNTVESRDLSCELPSARKFEVEEYVGEVI